MHREIFTAFFLASLSLVCILEDIGGVKAQLSKKEVVSYSLISSKLTLHEPVIISFTINNIFAESITVDLGADRKEGFRFAVTRPDGASAQLPPLSREGLARKGKILVKPGQSYSQHLLVNEWVELSAPGLYAIEVWLVNPVRNQKGRTVSVSAKFRTSLEVAPRDVERLRNTCDMFFQQIVNSKSYEQAANATYVLSYVKDPAAVPYLEKALKSNRMVESIAIAGLEKVGDQKSVEALISALGSKAGDTAVLARSALIRIEKSAQDPAIKEAIRRAL